MTSEPRTLPASEPAAMDAIADHLEHFFRTVLAPDDAVNTPASLCYITREPHPLGNLALFSRAATPADIARDAAPLREGDFPSAIAFLNDGTPDQIAAATDLSFTPAESMPLMSVTPDTLAPTALADGYTCREVTPDEADAWAHAVSDGYGLPLAVGALLGVDRAAARAPGAARYYAAEHDGRMVATSLVFLHDGFAGIYGVATLPEHRGKGLGAHLTAEPLRSAWDLGYTTGLLQASEMGAPVYTRIGFRTHGHMALLVRVPGAPAQMG
ncbi:MAG: GNAT family N-acetyltransferase [Phycisphaeraceae bacterium]|nr:MAG: GNAT family N-acetyltransferase [Phycisphaeraceae bacterium]